MDGGIISLVDSCRMETSVLMVDFHMHLSTVRAVSLLQDKVIEVF